MFVDASAIVAILTREPDADALADVLENARAPIEGLAQLQLQVFVSFPRRVAEGRLTSRTWRCGARVAIESRT